MRARMPAQRAAAKIRGEAHSHKRLRVDPRPPLAFTDHMPADVTRRARLERRIRALLLLFIVGLVLSGLTAFPLESELRWLTAALGAGPATTPADVSGVLRWLVTARDALADTNARYPFLAYGYDWLAFAHLAIAVAFVGPLRDPVRNEWVVTWGLVACAGVVPLAFVAGAVRDIPLYWRLIDCSFGVGGAALLWPVRRAIGELEGILAAPLAPNDVRPAAVADTEGAWR